MHSRPITRLFSHNGGSLLAELPPVFLAPSLQAPSVSSVQCSKFSTSSSSLARKRDLSRNRGVSAIRRTGPRKPLSVSKYPLPRPAVKDQQETRQATPDHGLWGFFPPNRECIPKPEEEYAHGRSWSIQELRGKSWDDLHCLWFVCAKERNRIATSAYERHRLAAGYGDYESENRDKTVRRTQLAIKHVLRERWNAWNEARELYNNGYRPGQEKESPEDQFEPEPVSEQSTSQSSSASASA